MNFCMKELLFFLSLFVGQQLNQGYGRTVSLPLTLLDDPDVPPLPVEKAILHGDQQSLTVTEPAGPGII